MISAEGVTKRFGRLVAVDDVDFEIGRGEVVGFLGPNGAGKTTTMRMLVGALQPDAGEVRFDGRPIGDDLDAARSRVGYLPESNPLYDDMLVVDYLAYAGHLRGLDGMKLRQAMSDAAAETGIAEVFFRPIGELSKGYRQRVGLAAAILHRPEILVLDEPTEGLDPNQRVEIRRLVGALGRERTVLLSSHVMQEVEAVCGRLLIIHRGRLVADGGVADLLAGRRGLARYVAEVAMPEPSSGTGPPAPGDAGRNPAVDAVATVLGSLPGVTAHEAEAADGRVRIRLSAAGEEDLRPRIFESAVERGWALWELHRERASLEELFRELTAGSGGGDTESHVGAAAESRTSAGPGSGGGDGGAR